MAEKKEIVFRRIGGRIVPIRVTKETKAALQIRRKKQRLLRNKNKKLKIGAIGAASTVAGVGLALTGGVFSGRTALRGFRKRQLAFSFLKDFNQPEAILPTSKMLKRASSLKRIAPKIRKTSKILSASLIGFGISKVVESTGIDDSLSAEFASEVAGFSAATAVLAGSRKARKGTSFRAQAKAGLAKGKGKLTAAALSLFRKRFKF